MLSRGQLHSAIVRLNELLCPAVTRAEKLYGERLGENCFRGLAVEFADVIRVLSGFGNKRPRQELDEWPETVVQDDVFRWLKEFDNEFNEVDFGILLLAIAPEMYSGYELVFGFIQDNVTRRRVTIELAIDLLEPVSPGKQSVMERLSASAPLLSHHLIELADPPDGRTGLNAKVIRLNEQFARWLFGVTTLDSRLVGIAELGHNPHWDCSHSLSDSLSRSLRRISGVTPLRLYLHGPDGHANLCAARFLAKALGRCPLIVDTPRLVGTDRISETAHLAFRETAWFKHLLVFTGLDALHEPDRQRGWEILSRVLCQHSHENVVLLGGRPTLPPSTQPLSVMSLEIPRPDADERYNHWNEVLKREKIDIEGPDVQLLADRYSLTQSQIELTFSDAAARAKLRSAQANDPTTFQVTFDDLSIAARTQGGHDLESLTTKIPPRVYLKDLVVSDDVRDQLNEIRARIDHRAFVLGKWGFGRRQSYGLGINALFAGPSGTGKTMAAEALAHELGKDLYKIDLTSVVSKYIGETEQKLEQVFLAGEATQAVLFFDEADSLLGKRSEVKDAHDRYANLEVSYLLQRMERYDGLIVLATNLLGNLDEAFLRRMAALIHFTKPDVIERRALWDKVWPTDSHGHRTVPLAPENSRYAIDFDFLAERFELTGGNIRNAAVAAAFSVAARNSVLTRKCCPYVTMADVLHGVRREFQKLGQWMTDADLGLDVFKPPVEAGYVAHESDTEFPSGERIEVCGAR